MFWASLVDLNNLELQFNSVGSCGNAPDLLKFKGTRVQSSLNHSTGIQQDLDLDLVPVLAEQKQLHGTVLPPPCFKVYSVYWLILVFVPKVSFRVMPK